jgi:hypothetical protein
VKSTHLKVIFLILLALIGVYGVVRWVSGSGDAPDDERIPEAATGAELIRVLGPGDTDSLRIEAIDGNWTVNGYPADTSMVRRLRAGLDSARVGRLVARSTSTHERLEVTEALAHRVEIGPAASPTLSFLLGKAGADGRFIRFPPSEEVYAVPSSSVRLLERSLEDWRSRVVAEADTGSLIRVVVRRNDQPEPSVLTRTARNGTGESAWQVAGEAADSAAVAGLLEEANRLEATGFPTDAIAFAADFSRAVASLDLFDSDGPGAAPAVSLLFLTAPDAPEFLVRRADDPLAYRISAVQAERLLPTRGQLLGGELGR